MIFKIFFKICFISNLLYWSSYTGSFSTKLPSISSKFLAVSGLVLLLPFGWIAAPKQQCRDTQLGQSSPDRGGPSCLFGCMLHPKLNSDKWKRQHWDETILDWGSPFSLFGPAPKLVVYFHRQLAFDAAAHFGAPLPPPPRHVHHRNGSKMDNSLANLEILNAAAHHCLHPPPPNHGPKRVMAQPQNQGVQKEAKKHMFFFLYQIQPSIKKCWFPISVFAGTVKFHLFFWGRGGVFFYGRWWFRGGKENIYIQETLQYRFFGAYQKYETLKTRARWKIPWHKCVSVSKHNVPMLAMLRSTRPSVFWL